MGEWSWSWVTVWAFVGFVCNIALPIFLSRVERNTTISISKQIPLGQDAANATLFILRDIARGRRKLLFLGVPVQLLAIILSGFRLQFPISPIAAVFVELAAIGFVAFVYSKWRHTFHPQSVKNVLTLVHQRMSAAVAGAHNQNRLSI